MSKEAKGGWGGGASLPAPTPRPACEDLKVVSAPWMGNVFLICAECGKGKAGKKLKKKLEGALEARGLRKKARVLTVGCFGVCPKGGRVSVLLPGGACAVVDPVDERRALVRSVTERLEV